MTKAALAMALGGSVLASAPAWAHVGGMLTLPEAIAIAQGNSLAVQTSDAKIDQAKSQIAQTYSGLYPQLSLSESGLTFHQLDSGAGVGLGGLGGFGGFSGLGLGGLGGLSSLGSLGGSGTSNAPYNLLQTSVSLTQVVFDGFQTADALKIADASVKLGEIDRKTQLRKAAYDAASAYFQVLEAQESARLADQNLRQANAHL
ncbi:MAG: TolC family protein, partial [Cyanobacteria bacterium REEB65]|nr:TolC family protein [Cyanobacteria bacterium REEB65]